MNVHPRRDPQGTKAHVSVSRFEGITIMTTTSSAGPTPPEHPGRGRTRAERARQRALRRANRRAVRRALLRARRTRQPSPSATQPTPPASPGSWTHPRPFTNLAELYEEIEREGREATYLGGLRLVMFTILVGVAFVTVMPLLITAPQPTGLATMSTVTTATVRRVAVSAPLSQLPPTTATPDTSSAPAMSSATALAQAPDASSFMVRATGAALPFTARDGEPDRCDDNRRAVTDIAPTNRDGNSNRRTWVVHGGPIDISVDLDIAARQVCDDHERADARQSANRDRDSDSKDRDRKEHDRAGCTCVYPNRDGWGRAWDSRDWPGRSDDYRPAPPGYGPSGYGPSGYGPSAYGPSGYGPSAYGPSGYGPYDYYPRPGERPGPQVCRAYRPGEHPDLPYGGTVCTSDDRSPRVTRHRQGLGL
jgi:hypothetical protein